MYETFFLFAISLIIVFVRSFPNLKKHLKDDLLSVFTEEVMFWHTNKQKKKLKMHFELKITYTISFDSNLKLIKNKHSIVHSWQAASSIPESTSIMFFSIQYRNVVSKHAIHQETLTVKVYQHGFCNSCIIANWLLLLFYNNIYKRETKDTIDRKITNKAMAKHQKTNRQIKVRKNQHRKLKSKQHEPHQKLSGSPER